MRTPTADDLPRVYRAQDVATVEPGTKTIIARTDVGRTRYELRIRSHRTATRLAGVLSVAIVVSTAFWVYRASQWFRACADVGPTQTCDAPADWFRVSQFGLALVGCVTGAVIATYLAKFAWSGRVWRNSRRAAIAHGAVVFAWLVVWTIGVGLS